MKLPRNAQIWLPGYWKTAARHRLAEHAPRRVWFTIGDHYEPLWNDASLETGLERVRLWRREWPRIAARHRDSLGRPAMYSFFYPEDQYKPELLDPLAEMREEGVGDVEVHLHHDGEGERDFMDRMGGFKETLYNRHGLLRKHAGEIVFGFIHGNWALDNSRGGHYCGLDNEITLLRQLGCYADFSLPSAPYETQTRMVNRIYWATDDPGRPKSHDTGIEVRPGGGTHGDLLMIPGPLALNWKQRRAGLLPKVEVGELAGHNPVTAERVQLWLDYSPRIGGDVFVKLFAHGAPEKNSKALLGGGLDAALGILSGKCRQAGLDLRFASAWEMAQAVLKLASGERDAEENMVAGTIACQQYKKTSRGSTEVSAKRGN